jgi:hypothetical protein
MRLITAIFCLWEDKGPSFPRSKGHDKETDDKQTLPIVRICGTVPQTLRRKQ